jgi:hypothetical protein
MTNSKWCGIPPYIISDKGNDLIPGAKAYSDPSATIRKASTFILDMRKVFDNRSLDYNEGWKRACCQRKY